MPSKSKKGGFYAVARGKKPGIYHSWDEAFEQVKGFNGAVHKKFLSEQEAKEFIKINSNSAKAPIWNIASNSTSKSTAASSSSSSSISTGAVKRKITDEDTATNAKSAKIQQVAQGTRIAYCDGACTGNGKVNFDKIAGAGVYWEDYPDLNVSDHLPGPPTNNRAELYAIIRVLETDPNPTMPLLIKSDSNYCISCIEKYAKAWQRNGWKRGDGKKIKNVEMIRYILFLIQNHQGKVQFEHVRGHVGIHGNEMADKLANEGARKAPVSDADYQRLFQSWVKTIHKLSS